MGKHLAALIAALAGEPATPLADLTMLDPTERHHLLTAWNGEQTASVTASLPELFERQAARTPDAVAVTCADISITYAELNTRANRLAHQLIGAGARPERLVALILPRSIDLVVAILAVVKTGAAYVPI